MAAGIVPASLGGDTIGSIRVPASLCGVVGFKPTTGRWPRGGVAPISHTLDTTGVIARSVEDCALIDEVVTGVRAAGDAAAAAGLKGVRLAYAPRQFLDLIEPDVEARLREALIWLRDAGAEVVEVDLGDDFGALSQTATWSIFFHETMGAVSAFLREHGVPITFEGIVDSLKPELQGAWRYMVMPDGGGATSAETYQAALTVSRPEIQRRLDAVFAERGAQAMLQPTTPCTAPRIDQQTKFSDRGTRGERPRARQPYAGGEPVGPTRHQPTCGPYHGAAYRSASSWMHPYRVIGRCSTSRAGSRASGPASSIEGKDREDKMRFEKGHKAETRRHILGVASKRFRQDGISASGIAGIMGEAA